MWAHVDMQDREIRVPQGCWYLRVMSMSISVCQRRALHLLGRATDKARKTQWRDSDGEGKGAARTHKGGQNTDACRR